MQREFDAHTVREIDNIRTVDEVAFLHSQGPWETKSGAELRVLFSEPLHVIQKSYFSYIEDECAKLPVDIRGLRLYTVTGLAKGSVGGKEWHRIREEIVFCLSGSVKWICEDVHGKEKEFIVDTGQGVWIPPSILHTYETLKDNSGLYVLANTLFDYSKPETHDTFSEHEFRVLQSKT